MTLPTMPSGADWATAPSFTASANRHVSATAHPPSLILRTLSCCVSGVLTAACVADCAVYGEDDAQKKMVDGYDFEEDYSGPMGGSYFVPSKEKDEQGRPLRMLTRREAREERAREEEAKWEAQALTDNFANALPSMSQAQPEEDEAEPR